MTAIGKEIDKYKQQVKSYDAGNPNTVPGTRTMGELLGSSPQGEERSVAGIVRDKVGPVLQGAYQKSAITFPGIDKRAPIGQQPAPPTGLVAQAQQQNAEVKSEIGARNYRRDIDGLKAKEATANNPLPTPEQIKATILEKNGFERANAPKSANPGLTLSATPAEPEGPRKPLAYTGVFSQPDPQEALQRKQMEVMAAERADKTLLQAPGSRDYISPTLTEPQMRERQAEIATQRKQDMQDVISGNVALATVAATNDMATGKTSDRNLAMIPYAERRSIINTRNALMDNSASLEKDRKAMATADAERESKEGVEAMKDSTTRRDQDMRVDVEGKKLTSEERRAMLTDSTTRRGQDIEQETNLTKSEIESRSKALDRQAQKEVALIRRTAPVDRVKLESIKGYNKFIGEQIGLRPELQDDPAFLQKAMGLYGLTVEDLKAQMMSAVNPEEDEDFLN
jgi:hypothetical protein